MQNQNPSRSNAAPNVFIQQTPLPQHQQPTGYYQQPAYGQPNPTPNTYMGQSTGTVPLTGGMGGAGAMMGARPVPAAPSSNYGMSPAPYQLQSPSVMSQLGSPPMFSGGGPGSVPPVGGPASVGPASVGPAPGSVPPPTIKTEPQQPTTPARSDAMDTTTYHQSQSREQFQQQQRVAEPPRPAMSTIVAPYSQEVLDRLDSMSPMALAMTGRELVQDLINRSYNLTSALMKMSTDKQQRGVPVSQNDPEDLLLYCEQLMRRITEVRVRLDRLEQKEKPMALTEDDYLLMVAYGAEQDEKVEPDSAALAGIKKQHQQALLDYERNRDRLFKLSSGLKAIEWEATVSAPILSNKSNRAN